MFPEERTGNAFWATAALFLLAAVVGGGAFFLGQRNAIGNTAELEEKVEALQKDIDELKGAVSPPPQPSPSADPSATPVPTASASVSTSAETTTYTNDKYTYSLNYPKDWTIIDDAGKKDKDASKVSAKLYFTQGTADEASQMVDTSESALQTKIDELTAKYKDKTNYKKSSVTFVGRSATQITYTTEVNKEKSTDDKILIFAKDKYTYVLSGVTKDYLKSGGKDKAIFDTITNSFKFTK